MKQKRIEISAVEDRVYPVDPHTHGNRVGVGGTFVATYTVQFTNDPIYELGAAAVTWHDSANQTGIVNVSSEDFYNPGITAFRFRVTAYTSGTVQFNHSDSKDA